MKKSSMPEYQISENDAKGLEKMIAENYVPEQTEVVAPYPNKKIKILVLDDVPFFVADSDTPLRTLRAERETSRIIKITRIGGANYEMWFVRCSPRDDGYNYFDNLLEGARI